jgi:hypothetical protein
MFHPFQHFFYYTSVPLDATALPRSGCEHRLDAMGLQKVLPWL